MECVQPKAVLLRAASTLVPGRAFPRASVAPHTDTGWQCCSGQLFSIRIGPLAPAVHLRSALPERRMCPACCHPQVGALCVRAGGDGGAVARRVRGLLPRGANHPQGQHLLDHRDAGAGARSGAAGGAGGGGAGGGGA